MYSTIAVRNQPFVSGRRRPLAPSLAWARLPRAFAALTLLYRALVTQDMFLAASFIMILSTLTVIGTLLSDILLAWVDPRIRYE